MICLYSLVLENNSSLVRKMRKNCADIFSEASPKKLCENCAVQILHDLCTFFDDPVHVSHKFSGTSLDYPAYKFCTISQTCGMFLKSASVQANHVSTLIHCSCACFASNSRFMHLCQAALDTPPPPTAPSPAPSQFTVCTSPFVRLRKL